MKRGKTHDEALDALVGTIGITVMSYQETVESYLQLRRLTTLFTTQAGEAFDDPRVTDTQAAHDPSRA